MKYIRTRTPVSYTYPVARGDVESARGSRGRPRSKPEEASDE